MNIYTMVLVQGVHRATGRGERGWSPHLAEGFSTTDSASVSTPSGGDAEGALQPIHSFIVEVDVLLLLTSQRRNFHCTFGAQEFKMAMEGGMVGGPG